MSNKVYFGKGTLGSILTKLENNASDLSGMIAFGSAEENMGKGGAIFTDGKLVSSRILDYKVKNGKLYFYVINIETNLIEEVEININYGGGGNGSGSDQEINDALLTAIKDAILDDLKDNNSELSTQIADNIKTQLNAVEIVKAKDGSVITVNIETDENDGYQKYTLDLLFDENTLEITADGKLTVKNPNSDNAKDIFLDKAEIIKKEDGEKYIVLTFNDPDKDALEIPLSELFTEYKFGDGLSFDEESLTISIDNEILEKINKMYDELYGAENDIMPGMIASYRTLVSNLSTLTEKVDNLPDIDLIWQDLNNTTNE